MQSSCPVSAAALTLVQSSGVSRGFLQPIHFSCSLPPWPLFLITHRRGTDSSFLPHCLPPLLSYPSPWLLGWAQREEWRKSSIVYAVKCFPSGLCCGRVPCWLFSMRFWINMKSHLLTVISAKIFQLSSGGTLLPETPASRNTPAALGQTSLRGLQSPGNDSFSFVRNVGKLTSTWVQGQ